MYEKPKRKQNHKARYEDDYVNSTEDIKDALSLSEDNPTES